MIKTIPREVLKIKLAWLAGIIDGEGTIGFYLYRKKNGEIKQPIYGIYLVNTDYRMISEVAGIYRSFGYTPFFSKKNIYPKSFIRSTKQCWEVKLTRRDEIKEMLKRLIPYLVTKREQAELIYNFLHENSTTKLLVGRINNRKGRINKNHAIYLELERRLKEIKDNFKTPVETKQETSIEDEAIVRSV